MYRKIHHEFNTVAQECSEYEPIQTVKDLSSAYEETETEDAGCDSCIHSNNGQCKIYKSEYIKSDEFG